MPATTSPRAGTIKVLLTTGETITGHVVIFRPAGHDRLSDYAHIDERFRYVELDDRTLLDQLRAHRGADRGERIVSAVEGMLKMLTDTSAKGLRLAVGSPAKIIDAAGAPQDASSHPLTRQEILQLVGPIIPEHARRRLPQETTVEFDHASPNGAFKVTILRDGSEIAVSIVPDPSGGRSRAASRHQHPPPWSRRRRRLRPPASLVSRDFRSRRQPGDRSAVSIDGRIEGVGPALVVRACRRWSARTAGFSRSRRAPRRSRLRR